MSVTKPIRPKPNVYRVDPLDDSETVRVTNAMMQKVMAREKQQGRKAGRRELAQELGFARPEDLIAWHAALAEYAVALDVAVDVLIARIHELTENGPQS